MKKELRRCYAPGSWQVVLITLVVVWGVQMAAQVPLAVGAERAVTSDADKAAASASGASLRGSIRFEGTPPVRKPINMKKDRHCLKLHDGEQVLNEDVIVNENGTLRNVFVYLRKGVPKQDYPVPSEIARLDQRGCMYRPRVQGVRVGQMLLVGNSDPLTHNVRSFHIRNRPFNYGQKADSDPRERIFKRAEKAVEVQCDYHPWMRAYMFVMDHPFFAVTDDEGTFSIDGIPPGEYSVAAWHEELGEERETIRIGTTDRENVQFTFRAE